jgi:hypothetical protein
VVNATAAVAASTSTESSITVISFNRLQVASSSTVSSSGCSDWKKFVYSNSMEIVLNRPSWIQFSWITMASDRSFQYENASCANHDIIGNLLGYVAGLFSGSYSAVCGGSTWTVSVCDSSGTVGMCVDCDNPCTIASVSECDSTVSPCGTATTCSATSVIQSALVWFERRSVVPTISTVAFNVTRQSITVSLELSASGYVYCAAYESGLFPSSGNLVVSNGFSSSSVDQNATIVITGLEASTEYSMYCVPQSLDGIQAADSVALSNVWQVETKCCKHVLVTLSSATATSETNVFGFVSVAVDAAPSVHLAVNVSVVRLGLNSTSLLTLADQQSISTLYPLQLSFDATTSTSSLQFVSLLSCSEGYYEVAVALSGSSAAEFEVEYETAPVFSVISPSTPVAAPTLAAAVFSSDGSLLTLSLSAASNEAGLSSSFQCSTLFNFVNSGSCVCQWRDSATVIAYVSGDGNIVPGNTVTLIGANTLRAACPSAVATACSSWPVASTGTVTAAVSTSTSVLVPSVAITLPTSLSKCTSPTIDLSGSSGSGGRSWAQRSIVVYSSNGNSSALQSFINKVYLTSAVPVAIPYSLLQSGASYTFTVTLCNFLGACGQGRKTMTVLAGLSPVVSIVGPAARSVYRNSSLSLQSNAYMPSCTSSRGGSNVGLSYAWSVSPVVGISSVSRDPSAYLLSSYALTAGTQYVVSVSVVYSSTSAFASSSVKVTVVSGAVVAVVLGGGLRSVRLLSSIAIDASRSYDSDLSGVVGTNAGLLFTWSCLQTSPTITSTCPVSMSGADSLTLLAPASSANTTSSMSLLVQDSSRKRSGSAGVVVNVVSPVIPLVTMTSVVVAKVNPSNKLLLSGSVSLSKLVAGTVLWSCDSGTLDLSATALTSTTSSLTGVSSTEQLLISANSLNANGVYTFYLTATLSSGESSYASIKVTVNAPPSPGSFIVTPTSGQAVTDVFTLYSNNWVDADLPLTYQFGFVSPSFGSFMTLQSQSEVNFVSSLLPSGSGSDSALSCGVEIFDSYDANYTSYSTVQVTAMSVTVSEALEIVSNSLLGQLSSVNGMKKMVSLSLAVLSDVTCTNAPNCSALYRSHCSSVSNTCGECLDGYLGSSGVGNTQCVNSSQAVAILSGSAATSCLSGDDECAQGLYCNLVDKLCVSPSKTCLNTCSSNGDCEYIQTSIASLQSGCSIYDPTCSAQCSCSDEWFGEDCSLSSSDMATRQEAIGNITAHIGELSVLENPSSSAVSGWLSSISAVTNDPYTLNDASISSVQYIADYIVAGAVSVGMSVESVVSLLDAIDSTASAVSVATSAGRRNRRHRLLSTSSSAAVLSSVNSTASLLLKYGNFVSSSLVSGQSAVSSVKSTFRITSHLATSTTTDSSSVSVSLPTTTLEQVAGFSVSSVQVPLGSADSVPMSVMSLSSALYDNVDFNSDPLFLQLSETVCGSGSCEAIVVLKNSNPVSYSAPITTTFSTRCAYDDFSKHSYVCPDGTMVTASCNGSSSVIHTDCPYRRTAGACNSLSGLTGVSNSGCRTITYSATNTTCACSLETTSTSSMRRLKEKLAGVSTDDADSTSDSTTVSVNFVSMAEEIVENMKQTWSSAADLNLSSVSRGWEVILTIGVFAAVIIIALHLAHKADLKGKAVKPLQSDLTKASWTLQLRKKKHPDGNPQASSSSRKAAKLKRSVTLEDERNEIENSLPKILQSRSFSEKFWEEIKRFHRWFGVVFYFSQDFPRVLRIVSLVCSILTMLFIQALTYNFTNPDDGMCEMLKTESDCLGPRSTFDSSESKCYWKVGYQLGSCSFAQPADSLTVVLFVAVFAAIVSTPVAMTCEWLVLNVLAGKTIKYSGSVADLNNVSRRTAQSLPAVALPAITARSASVVISTTLEDDFEGLVRQLRAYRDTLSHAQLREFDELWGITEGGRFIAASANPVTGPRSWLGAATGGVDVQQMITNELRAVRSDVNTEFDLFSITSRSHAEKGQRILFLFQRDLMPGVNGQILEAKQRRDTAKPNIHHASTKLAAWLFIFALCLSMLFYIMLFALEQTKQRQSAWFRSFMIWLVLEICFTSTASVYVTHVFIPMIAMRDVGKIKQKLLSTIRDHYSAMKKAGDNENSALTEKTGEKFNAAEYLFVSYRLAKLFPELKESTIIMRYSTAWPKQSYLHKVDVSSTYSHKFSAVTSAMTMILIFLVTNLLAIPPTFQDMIIHIASTASIGYTVLLHVQLFQIYPVLVIVPTLLLGVIAHFLIKGGRSKAKSEVAKLMPVEEKINRSDLSKRQNRKVVSLDSIQVKIPTLAARPNDIPVPETAVAPAGNINFKSRRASLREGRAVMREILELDGNRDLRARAYSYEQTRHDENKEETKGAGNAVKIGDGSMLPSLTDAQYGADDTNSWYMPLSDAQLRAFEEGAGSDDGSDTDSDDDDADVDDYGDSYKNKDGSSSGEDSSGMDVVNTLDEPLPVRRVASNSEVSGQYIDCILSRKALSPKKQTLKCDGDMCSLSNISATSDNDVIAARMVTVTKAQPVVGSTTDADIDAQQNLLQIRRSVINSWKMRPGIVEETCANQQDLL